MTFAKLLRNFAIGTALAAGVIAPQASHAGVVISVGFAPPVLPVYAQPVIPGDGYIWTPGYWAYGPDGSYWVPGVWVEPPTVGFLWTPAYWGWEGGLYVFHEGYWGPHIGFYGGVNYGFGYFGHGFEGGYWNGGHFFYNHAYANFGSVHIANVYVHPVNVGVYNHVSFNGGPGGVVAHPMGGEIAAMHEQHMAPTANQMAFHDAAANNPAQRFSANGGHPGTMAAASTREGFGDGAARSVAASRPAEPVRPAGGAAPAAQHAQPAQTPQREQPQTRATQRPASHPPANSRR